MKTKALISFMVNMQLICAFGFAFAKHRFSYGLAHIVPYRRARWLSGRVSDSGERSRVRTPGPPCSVLEKDTLSSPKYWLIPRKQWLCPNMTEKLFTGTLNNNQTKISYHKVSRIQALNNFAVNYLKFRLRGSTTFLIASKTCKGDSKK